MMHRAEELTESCEHYPGDAEIPFDWLLVEVIGKHGPFEFHLGRTGSQNQAYILGNMEGRLKIGNSIQFNALALPQRLLFEGIFAKGIFESRLG